jgi:hypothetical protein
MTSADQSIEASREHLAKEFAALNRHSDSARLVWRDKVCDRFDKYF